MKFKRRTHMLSELVVNPVDKIYEMIKKKNEIISV